MQYELPNLSYHIYLFSGGHFFPFVSDLFNFQSKIGYFWKVATYGMRDLRAFIAFSKIPSLVPTWYNQ